MHPITPPSTRKLKVKAVAALKPPADPPSVKKALAKEPDLEKYYRRAIRKGLPPAAALVDAKVRLADFANQTSIQAVVRRNASKAEGNSGSRELTTFGPGYHSASEARGNFLGGAKSASIDPRFAVRQTDSYLKHPKYHEYYVRNHSRQLAMPLAATDSIANKTLPITATVSEALIIAAGQRVAIVPTPDHPDGVPYLRIVVAPDDAEHTTGGSWFGGISPQQLVGPSPSSGTVDDRSLQFKSGAIELSVSVAYNATCSLGYLDPYTTLQYGKSIGFVQQGVTTAPPAPGAPVSHQYRDWPYTTASTAIVFSDLMNVAVRQTLVGSTKQSGLSFRQILKPQGHCFNPVVDSSVAASNLPLIGWPSNTIRNGSGNWSIAGAPIFGQGIYLIDNSNSTSAVSLELNMDMHYRVRVDNQAPAVYNLADDRTTPKHSIEFTPTTAIASSRPEAAMLSARMNSTMPNSASTPITPASAAISKEHLPSWQATMSRIPVVGAGISKAAGGLNRAFTKGDDPAELFGGLGDFAMGSLDAAQNLFSFLDL